MNLCGCRARASRAALPTWKSRDIAQENKRDSSALRAIAVAVALVLENETESRVFNSEETFARRLMLWLWPWEVTQKEGRRDSEKGSCGS